MGHEAQTFAIINKIHKPVDLLPPLVSDRLGDHTYDPDLILFQYHYPIFFGLIGLLSHLIFYFLLTSSRCPTLHALSDATTLPIGTVFVNF